MAMRYGGPFPKTKEKQTKDAPRVKPGSLGWALFGDKQVGGGSDPIDGVEPEILEKGFSVEIYRLPGFTVKIEE